MGVRYEGDKGMGLFWRMLRTTDGRIYELNRVEIDQRTEVYFLKKKLWKKGLKRSVFKDEFVQLG